MTNGPQAGPAYPPARVRLLRGLVLHHHRGPDLGRRGRADALRLVPRLRLALGLPRLRTDGTLGLVVERLARASPRDGLRRRRAGGDGVGLLGAGGGAGRGRAQGLRPRRRSCRTTASIALLGASLLWFGWFGFNAGSALTTGKQAPLAFTNTLLAPAATLGGLDADRLPARAQGDRDRRGDGDRRRGGRDHAGGRLHQSDERDLAGGAGGVPVLRDDRLAAAHTRLDETLDVLAAHGFAGFTGILFIGFSRRRAGT